MVWLCSTPANLAASSFMKSCADLKNTLIIIAHITKGRP